MALTYIIISSLILAAVITSAYAVIYSRTSTSESYDKIDNFEDTFKFMMNKEAETTADVEEDLSVSEKLIESARRMSGEEFREVSYPDGQDAADEDKLLEEGVDYQDALDDLAAAYGCDFLSLAADGNGDYLITAATNGYTAYDRLSELDLVPLVDSISDRGRGMARLSGRRSMVFCTKVFDTRLEPDDAALIIIPLQSFIARSAMLTAALLFTVIAIFTALSVWLISIYRRIAGGIMNDEEKAAYSKKRIKSKIIISVIAVAAIACIGSAFSMSVDSVFLRTSRGTSTLHALFDRLDGDVHRTDVQWKDSQKRYIENARTLATLIDCNRSLQNEAWLKEASDIIDADYIMIFDSDGNEIISDSEYRGISLKGRGEADMADFARLLNGVESISHAGVHDEITGLTRDCHGISLKYLADKDSYGAMLIAVDPEEHTWIKFTDVSNVMDSMAPEHGFIMEVDPETGSIVHSSNRDLIGTRLNEKDTNDLFLGYLKLRNEPYYAVSASHGDRLYYYCIDKNYMFSYVSPFALCYTLVFLILYILLCRMLLRKYPEGREGQEKTVIFSEKATDSITCFIQKAAEINEKLLSLTDMPRANKRLAKINDWDSTPEREAMSILEILVFLFTGITGIVLLLRRRYSAGGTVLDYILTGNWTHGPNLFSFTAVYFLLCALFLILAVLKVVFAVLNTVLSKRVLTIFSLLLNILFYVALAGFFFLSLSYLGVNTKALIASAGFVGLAVSMSLQGILSDIFAGAALITGRTFDVGDNIEIKDGGAGTVTMIGLRRTELVTDSGETFSIRNSQIGRVINHSRDGGEACDKDKGNTEKKGKQETENDR